MKNTNRIRLFLLLITGIAIFTSNCKKNENEPPPASEPEPITVTDIDGNVYKAVTIGNQVWMAENLRVTHYRNGKSLPNITDNEEWSNLTTGAYCNYNNTKFADTVNTYGRLYNWYAVNDTQNIAPEGWHVATDSDWTVLINYLGGESIAGGKLKETDTIHWKIPNTGATNEMKFTALPSGFRYIWGSYDSMGFLGYWWSSTESDSAGALNRYIFKNDIYVGREKFSKKDGHSVRCVKD